MCLIWPLTKYSQVTIFAGDGLSSKVSFDITPKTKLFILVMSFVLMHSSFDFLFVTDSIVLLKWLLARQVKKLNVAAADGRPCISDSNSSCPYMVSRSLERPVSDRCFYYL